MVHALDGDALSGTERRFLDRALRRAGLFLTLSAAGVLVGVVWLAYTVYLGARSPEGPSSARLVIGVLVLLNARQNLRQYRYSRLLAKLCGPAPE